MNEIVLSEAQHSVVEAVRKLAPGNVLIVRGYAGTGKSTVLARVVAEGGVLAVLTPTGKAAARLGELGAAAMTIHQLLYVTSEEIPYYCACDYLFYVRRKQSRPTMPCPSCGEAAPREKEVDFNLRDVGDLWTRLEPGALLVVDEASMIGPQIARDLWGLVQQFELRLVLVGDNYQLPPVLSASDQAAYPKGFNVMDGDGFPGAAKVTLTEVFRQALDSPILAAATALRSDQPFAPSEKPEYLATSGNTRNVILALTEALGAGESAIALTLRNQDRHVINRGVRACLGHTAALPRPGEPLMVLVNNHVLGLMNGETVTLVDYPDGEDVALFFQEGKFSPSAIRARVQVSDGVREVFLLFDFLGGAPSGLPLYAVYSQDYCFHFAGAVRRRILGLALDGSEDGIWDHKRAVEVMQASVLVVDWGYCSTVHKAQGSEWQVVIVHVVGWLEKLDTWRRWLYTAFTRSSGRLLVIYEPGPIWRRLR